MKGFIESMEGARKIDRVCTHVREVCNTEAHGGRCMVVSGTTCMLTDYEEWNGDMHDRVRDRFPDVDVICTHNPHSSTSFSVVFSVPERDSLLFAFLVVAFIVIASVAVAFRILVPGLCMDTGGLGMDILSVDLLSCVGKTA